MLPEQPALPDVDGLYRVQVTQHALERWKERIGGGDADRIERTFRAAEKVDGVYNVEVYQLGDVRLVARRLTREAVFRILTVYRRK